MFYPPGCMSFAAERIRSAVAISHPLDILVMILSQYL